MRVESSSNLTRSEVDELKFSPSAEAGAGDPTNLPIDNDDLGPDDLLTAEVDMDLELDDDWDDDVDDLLDEDDVDDAATSRTR